MSLFKKATRRGQKIKFAITGPSGSGKTTAAIKMARGLVGPSGSIALIDTENGSASLYADLDDFDVLDLAPPYDQRKFGEAIKAAETEGYDALVIDSFSHVWEAILAYKDKLDNRGGNSFTNWNKAGQEFKDVLGSLLSGKMHVICCMRAKMEHVIEEDASGKKTVKKVGLAPIMRDGIEFEFTTVFDLDMSHYAAASKDRTRLFDGSFTMLTEETGEQLRAWLDGAAPEDLRPVAPSPAPEPEQSEPAPAAKDDGAPIEFEVVQKIKDAWKALEKPTDPETYGMACTWAGNDTATKFEQLTQTQGMKLLRHLQDEMNAWAAKRKAPTETTPFAPEGPKASFPTDIREWLTANAPKIDAYLVQIKWIKEGQTFNDLPQAKADMIASKTASFSKQCGIPAPAGKEAA